MQITLRSDPFIGLASQMNWPKWRQRKPRDEIHPPPNPPPVVLPDSAVVDKALAGLEGQATMQTCIPTTLLVSRSLCTWLLNERDQRGCLVGTCSEKLLTIFALPRGRCLHPVAHRADQCGFICVFTETLEGVNTCWQAGLEPDGR